MLFINPQLAVLVYAVFLTEKYVAELLKNVDYVVDCIDDAPAKLAIAEHCRAAGVPMVMCMGTGNRLSSEGLRTANFDKTAGCPLAKKMRLLLKGAGFRKLRALYSDAPTLTVYPIEDGGKRTVGSISYLPPIAGYKLAEHTIGRFLNQQETLDIPK
jgi:tRNA A37 threonylcarbamoyladenosine dehydratase